VRRCASEGKEWLAPMSIFPHRGDLMRQRLDARGVDCEIGVQKMRSAKIGISSRSSALRRVQSMPTGAAPGRLMRIVRVGVAITLSG
jgi:hypothetical protein